MGNCDVDFKHSDRISRWLGLAPSGAGCPPYFAVDITREQPFSSRMTILSLIVLM